MSGRCSCYMNEQRRSKRPALSISPNSYFFMKNMQDLLRLVAVFAYNK